MDTTIKSRSIKISSGFFLFIWNGLCDEVGVVFFACGFDVLGWDGL
jgi:hypothetical protein